jgi:hypothetical protein
MLTLDPEEQVEYGDLSVTETMEGGMEWERAG